MLFDLLKFNLSFILILFVPGYFLLKAIATRKKYFGSLEKFVLAFCLSLVAVDFIFMAVDKAGVSITRLSSLFFILLFVLGCFLWTKFKKRQPENQLSEEKNFYSKKEIIAFLLVFILAISLRTIYLSQKMMPQTTDLGHHLYWAKSITSFNELPTYNMPDFIIGEHIALGIIGTISGLNYIGPFPLIFLFIANMLSLLAVYLAASESSLLIFKDKIASRKVALLALFIIGAFFSTATPQAKYVSGGVIGNVLGNLLIPTIIFLLIKTINSGRRIYSSLAILLAVGLAYTHHLSTFMLLYTLIGFLALFLILALKIKIIKKIPLREFLKELFQKVSLFLNWKNLLLIFFSILFVFFIYTPEYLSPSAIDTAVGAPSKETRVGIPFADLAQSTGTWRFFYGFVALFLFANFGFPFVKKIFINQSEEKNQSESAFGSLLKVVFVISLLVGWGAMIFFMSYKPGWLKVDIISGRIANYLTYPTVLLGAFGFYALAEISRKKIHRPVSIILVSVLFATGLILGLSDIPSNKKDSTDFQITAQTFQASEYLAQKTFPDEIILKDHIYLPGDTWAKIFLMRGYRQPLSRSFLKRYDDLTKPRETCTRDMIAIPDEEVGRQCFDSENVKYIMLRKGYDTRQFEKSPNFSKIYSSREVLIFKRNE